MHNKIEVNLSLSPSATYNTIEANIIKKSCSRTFVDTALCISEAMFVTTPTNFTPANPLEYPKFPRHVRAEIGRRLFREKNPLGTTEPWTRSSVGRGKCRLPSHNALSARSAAAIVSDPRRRIRRKRRPISASPAESKACCVALFREREIFVPNAAEIITCYHGINYGDQHTRMILKGKVRVDFSFLEH